MLQVENIAWKDCIFSVKSIVCSRKAYRLVWNCSVKRKTGIGGDTPIDLAMEHYICIVKLLKRKLGSNQNNKQTLRRYMKALGFTKVLLEDFVESTCIIQWSGRHTQRSSAKDKARIVQELVKARAFVRQPDKKYNVFKNFKPSLLADFNSQQNFLQHGTLAHCTCT